jgi:uncharacterized protein (TIGR04141 family)
MIIADLLAHLGADDPSSLDCQLRFLDDARDVIGSRTVLECLSAELRVGDAEYIAYDGDFFQIQRPFVDRIDGELADIPTTTFGLPCYSGGAEAHYAKDLGRVKPAEFVVLDRHLLHLPGQTALELCDAIHESGAMVHLKRKGKSSTLSHLFLQAINSCEILRQSPEARAHLKQLVADRAIDGGLRDSILQSLRRLDDRTVGLDVVFAFLGDWRGRDSTSLPLFSRISLVQAVRRVGLLGYDARVSLVGLCL